MKKIAGNIGLFGMCFALIVMMLKIICTIIF